MGISLFRAWVAFIGLLFTLAFCVIVIPAFVDNPDVIGAFAAGFVNPFASGYSLDTIACWCILAVWVLFEAQHEGVRFGWVARVLGMVPGVAASFSLYLILRLRQRRPRP